MASTQPTARAPTRMDELTAALYAEIARELQDGAFDRQSYAALLDAYRHIKGIQRALKRLTDN